MSHTKPIDAAKETVSVLELAERLASEQGKTLRGHGAERFTSCLLPDHEDTSPSFYVNTEKGVWYCHGCDRSGDVVELYRFVRGFPGDGKSVAIAAAYLLLEFGHELPQRPPSWFRKQERQRPVRNGIDQTRFEHLRRRLFRRFFKPSVLAIQDVEEREAEYRILWDATEPLARMLLRDFEERRSG